MPDSKITALTALTAADPANDMFPIVDVSDTSMAASGTTKRISINNLLAASGTATLASATITGDLTVDTSTLKVDSTNNRVGIGTASPATALNVVAGTSGINTTFDTPSAGDTRVELKNNGTRAGYLYWDTSEVRLFADSGRALTFYPNGTLGMTLNSTGLGIGGSPTRKLSIVGSGATYANINSGDNTSLVGILLGGTSTPSAGQLIYDNTANSLALFTSGASRLLIDTSGNVGIGVTPSAWWSGFKAIESSNGVALLAQTNVPFAHIATNAIYNGTSWLYKVNSNYANRYAQDGTTGQHQWFTAPLGGGAAAGTAFTFTQAMTLDASGNLLCGATTGTSHNLRKQGSTIEGDTHLNVGNAEHLFFACSSVTYNAAAAAYKVTRNSSTLRSINAGGTINASGADYAEYMVKCGDFTLSKGGIAGIDANGKLTNVFADAISFVVKSTDPSYVGNDKWGVDLEGDTLEAARQLVDRIAFAGQVPVNVIGAKAGDYIVPVVDGTGIKGIAVASPTFEQYQIAVGKVITIDTDGRARIIVKVA